MAARTRKRFMLLILLEALLALVLLLLIVWWTMFSGRDKGELRNPSGSGGREPPTQAQQDGREPDQQGHNRKGGGDGP
jgi:hypothetical protein